MGKLVNLIMILVVLDLLFLVTGQLVLSNNGPQSVGSIIFKAILNINDFSTNELFNQIIGDVLNLGKSTVGFFSLAASSGIVILAAAVKSDRILFITIAMPLSLLINDFVVLGGKLMSYNKVLGIVIMAPILILYTLTMIEWVKEKD